MRHKIYFVSLLLLLGLVSSAQKNSQWKFTSINQVGTLIGQSPTELQVQTVNGVAYKKFISAAGIALDDYYEPTIPVFFDLRKSFFNRSSAPFIYGDLGYSFLVEKATTEWEMDRKGGIYYAVGIGYEFPFNKKVKALIDFGYSYKHFSKVVDNEPWRSSPHNFDTYDYSLNRILIKAGLRF